MGKVRMEVILVRQTSERSSTMVSSENLGRKLSNLNETLEVGTSMVTVVLYLQHGLTGCSCRWIWNNCSVVLMENRYRPIRELPHQDHCYSHPGHDCKPWLADPVLSSQPGSSGHIICRGSFIRNSVGTQEGLIPTQSTAPGRGMVG